MKRNLFFYLNKILYNEVIEINPAAQGSQPVAQNPVQQNAMSQNMPQTKPVTTVKTVIDQKFKDLFKQGGEKSLGIKEFLDNIAEKGDKNILNKIVNRLERKRDPETDEDRFINSKIDYLNKNSELKNSILKFIKNNSDLDIDELKQKFEKEDFFNKKNLFKQILSQIKYFQSLPENEKNKILEKYGKELFYDTVENVVRSFLKDEVEKKMIRDKIIASQKNVSQPTTPQQKMIQ